VLSETNLNESLEAVVVSALSNLVCRLGTGFVPYIIPVRRKLRKLHAATSDSQSLTGTLANASSSKIAGRLDEYEALVNRLLKQRPLPPEPADMSDMTFKTDEKILIRVNNKTSVDNSFQIGLTSLETAWALVDRNNASDLVEWMRRLTIELIRQSPSPIIRSCAILAKSYVPLAQELFNCSFSCIWEELFASTVSDVNDDIPLINGIEMALNSPQIPPYIQTSLLNLSEFMEMRDQCLPIDVRLLARQAQAANMFAKSLRFREIEFGSKNVPPSTECVNALISLNNQLGLHDRAIGVLDYLEGNYPDIEIQPQWLEKLCRWEDARQSYEAINAVFYETYPNDTPCNHAEWMNAELGRLRCLSALGEYEGLESRARKLKEYIKMYGETSGREGASHSYSFDGASMDLKRLGANAAWMLGEWTSMDEFLESDHKITQEHTDARDTEERGEVMLGENLSFYKAVLAIHNRQYDKARAVISDTRSQLSGSIRSLLSESYSRANRAMVTMQVLSEMEEVVDFKQVGEMLLCYFVLCCLCWCIVYVGLFF
jgi:FKBP12-rapamycin complex-associated protein